MRLSPGARPSLAWCSRAKATAGGGRRPSSAPRRWNSGSTARSWGSNPPMTSRRWRSRTCPTDRSANRRAAKAQGEERTLALAARRPASPRLGVRQGAPALEAGLQAQLEVSAHHIVELRVRRGRRGLVEQVVDVAVHGEVLVPEDRQALLEGEVEIGLAGHTVVGDVARRIVDAATHIAGPQQQIGFVQAVGGL